MLTAAVQQGWRGPYASVWGTADALALVPALLCDPGNREFARLEAGARSLWVDVMEVDEAEPLDDIGQRVLRATVVAEDRVRVAISAEGRAQLAEFLAELIGRLEVDRPEGDHVHLEWFHPIDDPAVTDEYNPYLAWVFTVMPSTTVG